VVLEVKKGPGRGSHFTALGTFAAGPEAGCFVCLHVFYVV